MNDVVYVCTGTCKAEISEKQYKEGLTKCGAKECSRFGHNFVRMFKCGKCGKLYKENESHEHII